MKIEDTERQSIEAAWDMGQYTKGECKNCGRQRVCFCQNGKKGAKVRKKRAASKSARLSRRKNR